MLSPATRARRPPRCMIHERCRNVLTSEQANASISYGVATGKFSVLRNDMAIGVGNTPTACKQRCLRHTTSTHRCFVLTTCVSLYSMRRLLDGSKKEWSRLRFFSTAYTLIAFPYVKLNCGNFNHNN